MGNVVITPLEQQDRVKFSSLPCGSFFLSGSCITRTKRDELYFKADDKSFFGVGHDGHIGIGPDLKEWTVWEVDAKITYGVLPR